MTTRDMKDLRRSLDAGKLAAVIVEGIAAMAPADRAPLEAKVDKLGGWWQELDFLDDGTVTVKVAGFVVANVPLHRVSRTPRGDA